MGKKDAILDGEALSASNSRRRADEITKPVDRADGGVLEWAREEAAGEVRGVMLDIVHARGDTRFVQPHRISAGARERPDRHHICGPVANQPRAWAVPQREQSFS